MLNRQMERMADVAGAGHDINQFVGNVLGMGRHKADALNAHLIERLKQLRKGELPLHVQPIGVDVLPQQHDLPHALCLELTCLFDNPRGGTGTLPSAHIGHNAVGTEVVAAIHDRDVGMIGAAAVHGQRLGNASFLFNHLHHTAARLKGLKHELRKAVKVVRAKRHIYKRILPENPLAHPRLLHHAATDGHHHLRPRFLELLEPHDVSKRAPLGIVPYTAGVEDHKIRGFAALCLCHAHFKQHAFEFLAVVRIHLATIRHHEICAGTVFS